MAGLATLLLDNVGELLDLALGAEEGAELGCEWKARGKSADLQCSAVRQNLHASW